MARPRFDRQHEGLTRTEVAAQLGYSPSNVRRLQKAGLLPLRKDRNGIYRFRPHEVAEVARKRRAAFIPGGPRDGARTNSR